MENWENFQTFPLSRNNPENGENSNNPKKHYECSQSSHYRKILLSRNSLVCMCDTKCSRDSQTRKFICNMLRRITSDFLLSHLERAAPFCHPRNEQRFQFTIYREPMKWIAPLSLAWKEFLIHSPFFIPEDNWVVWCGSFNARRDFFCKKEKKIVYRCITR